MITYLQIVSVLRINFIITNVSIPVINGYVMICYTSLLAGPPKVKGELLPSDLPPIEDLHITVPEYECLEVGTVSSIVDQMVVVKSKPNTAALDLDSILFLDKGQKPLGKVFDVIGPVMQPFYCVRFNSNDHIREKNIEIGNPIFFAPRTEHTNFVFLAELMKK